MERIICLIIGYAFGLIQTAYILGRIRGIDIRKQGSGNAGSTNALRTLGRKAGLITVFVDVFKCIAAALIVRAVFAGSGAVPLYVAYASAGVVLGHDFPFYLGFKGGKGIAATVGMIIAFADWRLIIVAIIAFMVPYLLTHFVSLSSLCLSASFLVGIIICGNLGSYGMSGPRLTEMYIVVLIITALAFFLHRSNIKRLAGGKERKTYVVKRH